jgi:uncharacterized membrane protein YbaN (DUF454 family)
MLRGFWTALGLVALGLGAVGLVLPLMPTTPFALLAVFAFGRGSPRLRRWMLAHPAVGPPIRRWNEAGAIARRHKLWAMAGMAASLVVSLAAGVPRTALVVQVLCLAGAAAFILTRPDGPAGG